MSRKRRAKPGSNGSKHRYTTAPTGQVCAYCGKFAFESRKLAKNTMRAKHPGDLMSVYECREAPLDSLAPRWHYGHLASVIREGIVDRETVYSKNYRRPTTPKASPTDVANIVKKKNGH